MISLIPIHEERVATYLAAAFTAVSGSASIPPQREKELLAQIIALAAAQLNVASIHALPPDGAPIRKAMTKAVEEWRCFLHPRNPRDATEEKLRRNNAWDDVRRVAEKRLAALQR